MTGLPGAAILVALGYLVGALPFGLLIGRLAGVDLRAHGSGRTGATNALRTLGLAGAASTFVLDLGKGVLVVVLAWWLYQGGASGSQAWVAAAAGLAAIVGHIRSVFIGFGGGRGMATFTGAMLATSPWTVLILLPVVAVVVWRTRFVSLGSLVGSVLAPIISAALLPMGQATWPGVALGLGGAALVSAAHADNIARLRAGTERRIGR